MHYATHQKNLVAAIKTVAANVAAYYWKLSGDEPNSLCKLLSLEEEDLKIVLRNCEIYYGQDDFFNKNIFDEFIQYLSPHGWILVKIRGKREYFIYLGDVGKPECPLPKALYNRAGELIWPPVLNKHIRESKTRSQQGAGPRLLDFRRDEGTQAIAANKTMTQTTSKDNKPIPKTIQPTQLLLQYVKELIIEAGEKGNGNITERTKRKLHRLITSSIVDAARILLHSTLKKIFNSTRGRGRRKQSIKFSVA
jgi:hypothetical protein